MHSMQMCMSLYHALLNLLDRPCNVCIHIKSLRNKLLQFLILTFGQIWQIYFPFTDETRHKKSPCAHSTHRFYLSSSFSGASSPASTCCLPFAKGAPFVSSGAIFTSKSFKFWPSTGLTGDSLLRRYFPVVPSMANLIPADQIDASLLIILLLAKQSNGGRFLRWRLATAFSDPACEYPLQILNTLLIAALLYPLLLMIDRTFSVKVSNILCKEYGTRATLYTNTAGYKYVFS